ncbi:MAG: 2-C-methyl-D-erythritol 4-phosphate cytidylyltransferase [bacterium]|nr:2-C-methyl-D-erythritol 4-phosphate cytidylyltransferase [bacterium]
MTTTAIIVAAGSGSRFKSDTPKQFLEINGKPVIVHTIERFQSAPSVDSIVIVLAADQTLDTSEFPKVLKEVTGGATRAESVRNGFEAAEGADIVAVHDGARPLVTVDEIERTIAKAKETGAACLVAPVTDTIKSIRGDEIADTLDRAKLRRALTPQAFRSEVLRRAFDGIDLTESVTDECFLVEKLGHPIAIVEGSSRNIKITHPEDLVLAEALLSAETRY